MYRRAEPPPALPSQFLYRMQAMLGDDFPAFEYSYLTSSRTGLRVNTLKLTAEQFQAFSPFSLTPVPWCQDGFIVPDGSLPGKHPYHAAGMYYLQEPSTMAVAEILAPKPGERVLDLAAAPGGKTTHIAALMQNQGFILANEIHPKRAWDLAENLERCGVRIAAITNETPEHLSTRYGSYFDRVLIDAPCSGEGMFRKNPVSRSQWSLEHVTSCAIRQKDILHTAATMVKLGGSLVYSTCTFSPEENEMVIGEFLHTHPEFTLVESPNYPGISPGIPAWAAQFNLNQLEKTVRIWPHLSAGEGHFIAHLKRSTMVNITGYANRSAPATFFQPLEPGLNRLYNEFANQTLTTSDFSNDLTCVGSYLYQIPSAGYHPHNIKYVHPGFWLGTFKKKRFEPSHAFAIALKSDQVQRSVQLSADSPAITSYLRGESLPSIGVDGWTLMMIDDFPLGWGKRVNNTLKNFYPHGLRWR